jgi:hypothetical protein
MYSLIVTVIERTKHFGRSGWLSEPVLQRRWPRIIEWHDREAPTDRWRLIGTDEGLGRGTFVAETRDDGAVTEKGFGTGALDQTPAAVVVSRAMPAPLGIVSKASPVSRRFP